MKKHININMITLLCVFWGYERLRKIIQNAMTDKKTGENANESNVMRIILNIQNRCISMIINRIFVLIYRFFRRGRTGLFGKRSKELLRSFFSMRNLLPVNEKTRLVAGSSVRSEVFDLF
ncbi:hypothetical protein DU061_24200 [Salmonella enterica subsp. enterica]|nr:hypothetical protein [Salmonella enterica subsp. enterica serovar Agona]